RAATSPRPIWSRQGWGRQRNLQIARLRIWQRQKTTEGAMGLRGDKATQGGNIPATRWCGIASSLTPSLASAGFHGLHDAAHRLPRSSHQGNCINKTIKFYSIPSPKLATVHGLL